MSKQSELPAQALSKIFKERVSRNSKYSLRAFARDLGVSAGRLSLILSGKEKPGLRLTQLILKAKGLDDQERKRFSDALRFSKGLSGDGEEYTRELSEADSLELSSVVTHAVFALLKTTRENGDPQWISKKLSFCAEKVKNSLSLLEKHKVIKKDGANYQVLVSNLLYHAKESSHAALAVSCRDHLSSSLPNLLEQEMCERIFGFSVLALSKKDLPRVRKIMEKSFEKILAMSDNSERTEVFHMSFVMQPISHKPQKD